jgi:hypothetical protein
LADELVVSPTVACGTIWDNRGGRAVPFDVIAVRGDEVLVIVFLGAVAGLAAGEAVEGPGEGLDV